MRQTSSLRRLYWTLVSPALVSQLALSLSAFAFSLWHVSHHEGSLRPSYVGFGVGILAFLSTSFLLVTRTPSILRLARSATPTKALITAAILEARRYPRDATLVILGGWLAGSFGPFVARLYIDESNFVSSTAMFIQCLAVGPVNAALAQAICLTRSRRVVAELLGRVSLGMEERHALLSSTTKVRSRLTTFALLSAMPAGMMSVAAMIAELNNGLAKMVLSDDVAVRREMLVSLGERIGVFGLVAGLILGVFSIWGAVAMGRAMREPLLEMNSVLERMVEGDLTGGSPVIGVDEIGEAAAAVESVHRQLGAAIQRMRTASGGVKSATEFLTQIATNHEQGAASSAASLITTVATTDELARSARLVADTANSLATLAQNTLRAAQNGQGSSQTFVQAMERTKAENQAIADAIIRLNKRVQQIGKVVEFINGVADKSDLLALNAELEGTKAGDVGQGFSLVAAEMRRLSEAVLSSTNEISKLIDEVKDATHAAVMATEAGVKATEQGVELAAQVSERLAAIVRLADETSDAVRAISLSTQQQQSGTDQLAEAMSAVLQGTEAEAEVTHESIAANTDLAELAEQLTRAVESFQVRDISQAPGPRAPSSAPGPRPSEQA